MARGEDLLQRHRPVKGEADPVAEGHLGQALAQPAGPDGPARCRLAALDEQPHLVQSRPQAVKDRQAVLVPVEVEQVDRMPGGP